MANSSPWPSPRADAITPVEKGITGERREDTRKGLSPPCGSYPQRPDAAPLANQGDTLPCQGKKCRFWRAAGRPLPVPLSQAHAGKWCPLASSCPGWRCPRWGATNWQTPPLQQRDSPIFTEIDAWRGVCHFCQKVADPPSTPQGSRRAVACSYRCPSRANERKLYYLGKEVRLREGRVAYCPFAGSARRAETLTSPAGPLANKGGRISLPR